MNPIIQSAFYSYQPVFSAGGLGEWGRQNLNEAIEGTGERSQKGTPILPGQDQGTVEQSDEGGRGLEALIPHRPEQREHQPTNEPDPAECYASISRPVKTGLSCWLTRINDVRLGKSLSLSAPI